MPQDFNEVSLTRLLEGGDIGGLVLAQLVYARSMYNASEPTLDRTSAAACEPRQATAQVFLTLPKAEAHQTSSATTSTRTTLLHRQFLEALPAEFDRQTYTSLAAALGINPRTADRIIRRRCDTGQIENISHGRYRKASIMH